MKWSLSSMYFIVTPCSKQKGGCCGLLIVHLWAVRGDDKEETCCVLLCILKALTQKNLASSGCGISFIKCIWEAFHNVQSHERCKPAPWVERKPMENSWAIKWIVLSCHSADENMPNPKSLIFKKDVSMRTEWEASLSNYNEGKN